LLAVWLLIHLPSTVGLLAHSIVELHILPAAGSTAVLPLGRIGETVTSWMAPDVDAPANLRATDFLGTSILHNSQARGLHGDAAALALLNAPPPQSTAIEIDIGAPHDFSIVIRAVPTVVRGVDKSWRGTAKWDSEANLRKHFGKVHFDLAADLSMSVEQYAEYSAQNTADFPYYIYEREYIGECAQLLNNFVKPSWIEEDLLELVPDLAPRKCIPALLIGGPRTGSPLHVDPLCTCGWNVCCFGAKRWLFLAPNTDVAALGLDECLDGPALWFVDKLPQLQAAAAVGKIEMRECIQKAGDLVFIPHGWHHGDRD